MIIMSVTFWNVNTNVLVQSYLTDFYVYPLSEYLADLHGVPPSRNVEKMIVDLMSDVMHLQ